MLREIGEIPTIDEAFFKAFCSSGKNKPIARPSTKEERQAAVSNAIKGKNKD